MDNSPSTTEGNGRGPRGRFAPGNAFAKGNPHAAKVAKLRTAALNAVKPKELAAVVRKLLELALAGDVAAAREVLSRCLGPAEAVDVLAELSELRADVDLLLDKRQSK
jgi:hypothetical protein